MDWMKEIYDAASSRIKSPILGSVAVAFVLFNWKPLYFLFFSGQQALEKFDYFEAHTNHSSLYYYPISVGIGLALVAPFISYFGSWCASRPLLWKRLLEDTNAHRVLEQKNQLALERKNAEALFEQTLIDRAKRDEEVKQIDDLETRKVLKKRIESVRSSLLGYEGDERKSDRKFVLSKLAWDILIWAEQSGDKILVDRANAGITVDTEKQRFIGSHESGDAKELEKAIDDLHQSYMIHLVEPDQMRDNRHNLTEYALTDRGRAAAESYNPFVDT